MNRCFNFHRWCLMPRKLTSLIVVNTIFLGFVLICAQILTHHSSSQARFLLGPRTASVTSLKNESDSPLEYDSKSFQSQLKGNQGSRIPRLSKSAFQQCLDSPATIENFATTVSRLWELTETLNILHEKEWTSIAHEIVRDSYKKDQFTSCLLGEQVNNADAPDPLNSDKSIDIAVCSGGSISEQLLNVVGLVTTIGSVKCDHRRLDYHKKDAVYNISKNMHLAFCMTGIPVFISYSLICGSIFAELIASLTSPKLCCSKTKIDTNIRSDNSTSSIEFWFKGSSELFSSIVLSCLILSSYTLLGALLFRSLYGTSWIDSFHIAFNLMFLIENLPSSALKSSNNSSNFHEFYLRHVFTCAYIIFGTTLLSATMIIIAKNYFKMRERLKIQKEGNDLTKDDEQHISYSHDNNSVDYCSSGGKIGWKDNVTQYFQPQQTLQNFFDKNDVYKNNYNEQEMQMNTPSSKSDGNVVDESLSDIPSGEFSGLHCCFEHSLHKDNFSVQLNAVDEPLRNITENAICKREEISRSEYEISSPLHFECESLSNYIHNDKSINKHKFVTFS